MNNNNKYKVFILFFIGIITCLPFLENDSYKWIKGNRIRKYILPENSSIITTSVRPGDKIYYDYHFIKIQKKS